MTGAIATIAELPQIALPQAISSAMRVGRPSSRPIPKLSRIAVATTTAMPTRSGSPAAAMVAALTEAPSKTTATSRRYLVLKAMPSCHLSHGVHRLRTVVPIRMASTNASSHTLPANIRSPVSKAKAAPETATQSPMPGASSASFLTRFTDGPV